MSLFVDTVISKVHSNVMAGVRSASEEEREAATEALVEGVIKEIEPLLVKSDKGQGPFFGGSEKLTFAEVSLIYYIFPSHFPSFSLPHSCNLHNSPVS